MGFSRPLEHIELYANGKKKKTKRAKKDKQTFHQEKTFKAHIKYTRDI